MDVASLEIKSFEPKKLRFLLDLLDKLHALNTIHRED